MKFPRLVYGRSVAGYLQLCAVPHGQTKTTNTACNINTRIPTFDVTVTLTILLTRLQVVDLCSDQISDFTGKPVMVVAAGHAGAYAGACVCVHVYAYLCMCERCNVAVVAFNIVSPTGGIYDGRGLAMALSYGASAGMLVDPTNNWMCCRNICGSTCLYASNCCNLRGCLG